MVAIPKELLTEILIRLPAKTLVRFLFVSKAWYSIIKDDYFIKQHLNYENLNSNYNHPLLLTHSSVPIFPDNNGLKFSQYTDPHKFLNHPLDSKPLEGIGEIVTCSSEDSNLHFCGTCNGIVCIFHPEQNRVRLFNPTTKSCRFLPDVDIRNTDAFVIFGFGYDSKSDDYKVLRLTQSTWSNDQINTDVRVYNLRRNSWKMVYNQINTVEFSRKNHGVLVNEGLYYIIWDSIKKKTAIAKLDVVNESFSYLELPDDYVHHGKLFNLANLGGRLSCVAGYNLFLGADLWIMGECGKKNTWVKFLNITTGIGDSYLMRIIYYSQDVQPVALSNNGEIILAVSGKLLYWYDMISRRVTQVREGKGLGWGSLHAVTFVESLVSVDGDDKGISILQPLAA